MDSKTSVAYIYILDLAYCDSIAYVPALRVSMQVDVNIHLYLRIQGQIKIFS